VVAMVGRRVEFEWDGVRGSGEEVEGDGIGKAALNHMLHGDGEEKVDAQLTPNGLEPSSDHPVLNILVFINMI
jgi:hypothetical protein